LPIFNYAQFLDVNFSIEHKLFHYLCLYHIYDMVKILIWCPKGVFVLCGCHRMW